MATTTKIMPTSTKHGYVDDAAYAYEGNIYIGKRDDGDVSRTRITVPSLRSIAAIGNNTIVITKIVLRMYRKSGGPVNTTAAVSSSSAWNAVADGSGTGTIGKDTGWYEIDLTSCAETILNYPGNWYIHLSGTGSRVMCNGIKADGSLPHVNVVWEYSANTLTTDVESVELGKEVHLNIASESGDARYALAYEFGDEAGTIAETSNTSISWVPPIGFAGELPDTESGEVKITMKVYDAEGNQKRTEILYLTVTVPEATVPAITDAGISLVNALGGYALTGKTYAVIAPVVNIAGAYGATVKRVQADIADGNYAQNIVWDTLTETDAGVFTCAAQATNIISNAGEAVITLTVIDSRGREVVYTHSIAVQAYWNPLITAFSVDRYEPVYNDDEQIIGYAPSDTGESVWVSLAASCAPIKDGGANLNFLSWKITARGANGETVYSGGGNVLAVNITDDRTIITAAVPAASAIDYTLEVTDTAGYAAYQYDSVTPGRANFALAPSKYGASFGCLPKGTEENPMLESAYPIYAYGGIDGVTKAKRTVLWTNPKPNDGMEANTIINLSSGDYDELIIYYKSTNAGTTLQTARVLKGYTAQLITMRYPSNIQIAYRSVGSESETQLKVAAAYGFDHKDNLISTADTKIVCVPYQIIGIKYS